MSEPITSFSGNYRWLSNFWYSPLTGTLGSTMVRAPTVEHAYQAAKTQDEAKQKEILGAATPGIAKRLGQKAKMRTDWESAKVKIMTNLVRAKFFQNPDLAHKLVETGDAELVEGNHWGDKFWGVCNGEGQNFLGKILMQIRQELRNSPGDWQD